MKKGVLYIVIVVIIIITFFLIIQPHYKIGGKYYSVKSEDLSKNFEKNKQYFFELKNYLDSLFPNNGFYLGYDGRYDKYEMGISKLEWSDYNTASKTEVFYYRVNQISQKSAGLKSSLDSLGISIDDFNVLLQKFEQVNCTFVSKPIFTYEPYYFQYGYDDSWLLRACFSYRIFNKNTPTEIIDRWDNKEGLLKINDSVFFEYGYPL